MHLRLQLDVFSRFNFRQTYILYHVADWLKPVVVIVSLPCVLLMDLPASCACSDNDNGPNIVCAINLDSIYAGSV